MNYKYNDLTGQKFGRLTVKELGFKTYRGYRGKSWLCECECGRAFETRGNSLVLGVTKSCGCLKNKQYVVYRGKEYTLKELSDKYNIPKSALYVRIKRGWSVNKALHTPIQKRTYHFDKGHPSGKEKANA